MPVLNVDAETPLSLQGDTADRPSPAPKAIRRSANAAAPTAPAAIAPNVVRFTGAGAFAYFRAAEPDSPALSAGENSAFHELARQLTVRLQTEPAREELRPPLPESLSVTAPAGRLPSCGTT